jgi:hypothetical protein
MKSSSIADSVFLVNLKYVNYQNKTKELFFKCLNENKDISYFKKKLNEIWGNIDHSYMDQEIDNYTELIHTKNIHDKEVVRIAQEGDIFELVPESVINGYENKFVGQKIKEYRNATKSYAYKVDKDNYLKQKVESYSNQIVPYFSTKTNEWLRDVELSTYASMVHNTNLTRAGWNQTIKDGDSLGQDLYWIPYHPFSCEHCIRFQNKPLTRREIEKIARRGEMSRGDLLHPNCKCQIAFYFPGETKFNYPKYSQGELQEQYDIRQKVNSLTLKKEKIKADVRIQESLGNMDEVDKLNQQRNSINKEIRELKEALPTTQMRNQVVAINR